MLPPPHGHGNPAVSVLVWILVLGGLCVGGFYAWKYASAQQSGSDKGRIDRPMPVIVDTAHVGDMNIYIKQVGNGAAYNTVTVRTRIDGQIQKIAFTEDQIVHKDDVLVEIDPRPYIAVLAQAQGQLSKDQRLLEQAQGQFDQAQGQLAQSQGQLAQAQATFDNAQRDMDRYHRAAEAVSEQQVTTAETTLATSKAALETAKAAVETFKAALTTAEAGIGSAKAAIEIDKAAIDAAKLNITYCTITSPITGRIGLRLIDEGNMVHAADVNGLVVINQVQPITVTFSPTQDDLPRLQKARLTNPRLPVEAQDRNRKHLADGVLESVDNQIDPTTATFKVKSVFSNEDNALFPSQLVNVRLLVNTLHDVMLVPDAAVQQSPKGHFCYVVNEEKEDAKVASKSTASKTAANKSTATKPAANKVVEMRLVKIGESQGGFTVIKQGIAAGEIVVTEGVDKLQPGSKVVVHTHDEAASQPASAPASQPGSDKGKG